MRSLRLPLLALAALLLALVSERVGRWADAEVAPLPGEPVECAHGESEY